MTNPERRRREDVKRQRLERQVENIQKAVTQAYEALRVQEDYEEALRVLRASGVHPEEVERARRAAAELPEEEAVRVAVEAVHEVRRAALGAGGFGREAITPAEAEEWVRRREERRKREGYRPV